jgi:sulfatase modifying factor 1
MGAEGEHHVKWKTVVLVSLGALLVLAGTAYWLERVEAVEDSAAQYRWGAGSAGLSSGDEMVFVPGGDYFVGDDWPDPAPDAPPRKVRVQPFYIDRHEVTNRQFGEFVEATGYLTTAEREGGAWIYRGGERDFRYAVGADWRHPVGPDSSIAEAMDHPVVLVSWEDAVAYAQWAGKRLPTEAEWEVAARGGISRDVSQMHDTPDPGHDTSANVWQGRWPHRNELKDGYFYTAPAGSFSPNRLGIYDMIGNVWEWTADWYTEDPNTTATGTLKVARGGSWFCSPNYSSAYRPGFRGKSPPTHAFNNVGFRCAKNAEL